MANRMSANNHIHIFSIGRGYRKAQIVTSDAQTKQRIGVSTLTLDIGLDHRKRYDEIATWLQQRGLTAPPYLSTKREVGQ